MIRKITHACEGTCSRQIEIEVEDGIVRSVAFTGGCHGNQQGVAALVRGMKAAEAVARLEGIDCRGRGTSCPDQLAKALKKALEHEKTPELAAKLAEEAVERDSWAAEVSQLAVPKLVEQVALNAWKEQEGSRVCLHLRPSQRHLNSASAQQKLAEGVVRYAG